MYIVNDAMVFLLLYILHSGLLFAMWPDVQILGVAYCEPSVIAKPDVNSIFSYLMSRKCFLKISLPAENFVSWTWICNFRKIQNLHSFLIIHCATLWIETTKQGSSIYSNTWYLLLIMQTVKTCGINRKWCNCSKNVNGICVLPEL